MSRLKACTMRLRGFPAGFVQVLFVGLVSRTQLHTGCGSSNKHHSQHRLTPRGINMPPRGIWHPVLLCVALCYVRLCPHTCECEGPRPQTPDSRLQTPDSRCDPRPQTPDPDPRLQMVRFFMTLLMGACCPT